MDHQSLSPETIRGITPLPTTTANPSTDPLHTLYTSSPITKLPSPLPPNPFPLTTLLTSTSLNSLILGTSNEFFAPASSLLSPHPPRHDPDLYIPTGKWMDGWETRRHNPAPPDWAIVKLGCVGVVEGVEIDTGFFNGNQAEEAALLGCFRPGKDVDEVVMAEGFEGWEEVLPRVRCGPACRQAWKINPTQSEKEGGGKYTHFKLLMYPDGGIARLRVYGHAVPPPLPPTPASPFSSNSKQEHEEEVVEELSSALHGSLALRCSDQHFGTMSNLLLPGRGSDMRDGWETARSRTPGHSDWVVIRLGLAAKRMKRVVVDTKDFLGNFPRGVRIEGLRRVGKDDVVGGGGDEGQEGEWREIVRGGERELGADREHVFEGEDLVDSSAEEEGERGREPWTHIKMTIYPDGGVKRLRVFGVRA
ncbi:MAG: hypothetical protein Q9227_001787 [Pyrenula ochraceoflavens]